MPRFAGGLTTAVRLFFGDVLRKMLLPIHNYKFNIYLSIYGFMENKFVYLIVVMIIKNQKYNGFMKIL